MDFNEQYQLLNPEQRQAVDLIDGQVMVLAGPGTGKTQLLSVRTANILEKTDLFPSNILILTYTNAGVRAMRERLAKIIGPNGYDVVVETFHGFANNLINDSEEAASVKGDRIELTELERISLLEHLLNSLEGVRQIRNPHAPYLFRGDIEYNISSLKRDGVSPEDLSTFLKNYEADGVIIEDKHLQRLKAFAKVYAAYEDAKLPENKYGIFDKRGRYDFDDMILLATEALKNEPDLLAKYQEQFQYVMVDEFQDTNGAQLKLLKSIFPDQESNVCVVGDDDQSIYRFQGASVGNFQIFSGLYKNVQGVQLKKNYRSARSIIGKSSEIIHQIPSNERVYDKEPEDIRWQPDKSEIISHQFGTVEEELTFLIQEINKIDRKEINETAVLVRTRKQAQIIIESFLQAGIPYSTDGKEDIRGEFRVLQLLKILRLAVANMDFDQKELLLFEILLSDYWQIDPHDLMAFVSYVRAKKSQSRNKSKRSSNKKPVEYRREEEQVVMDFANNHKVNSSRSDRGLSIKTSDTATNNPSLFSELLLRFPSPKRVHAVIHEAPTQEETSALSICREITFNNPNRLHKASWVINNLSNRAVTYPVFSLIMEFIQESGLIDFILKTYEKNEIVRLRELRSISSFVENLKKANQSQPGVLVDTYVDDLNLLEKHEIPLAGEMVSSSQEGVKILTVHSSKGLEFKNVFVPFCIQDKAWPKRALTNKIPLPHKLLLGQEEVKSKEEEKLLNLYDEIRLFYVAATRSKDRLVFTCAPRDKEIISQFLSKINLAPKVLTIMPEEEILIKLLKKSPQPDPVAFTRDTLTGLVQDIHLSPSSVNIYLSCQRRFLYDKLLQAPQPQTQAMVYGQCIHKALEKSFRRYMKEDKLPPLKYFEEQFIQELEWHGVDQATKKGCLDKLEDAKRWYEQTLANGSNKPVELERKITRELEGGIIFAGQFDKIEMVGNSGEARIIDYKTGEPDKHIKAIDNCMDLASEDCDDYFRQLVAYKLLHDKGHRPLRVLSGQLVFLDPVKSTVKKYGLEEGCFVTKTIQVTQKMVQDYENILRKSWDKIGKLEFERLPKYNEDKCKYCPYQDVCWK